MTRDIAAAPWIPILEPRAPDVVVLLVDDMLDIPQVLLDLVRHEDAAEARADGEDLDLAGVGVLRSFGSVCGYCVGYGRAAAGNRRDWRGYEVEGEGRGTLKVMLGTW